MSPSVEPAADWNSTGDGLWTRPMAAGEELIEYMNANMDGQLNLVTGITIATSFGAVEAEQRIHETWLALRRVHPLLAIKFGRNAGNVWELSYEVPSTPQAARRWAVDTLTIERGEPNLEDVVQFLESRKMPSSGGQAMLYFVPRASKRHSVILNASHTVNDVFAYSAVLTTFLEVFVNGSGCAQTDKHWGDEVANLPRSLERALETDPEWTPVTDQDRASGAEKWMQQLALMGNPYFHIPMRPEPDIAGLTHDVSHLTSVLSAPKTSLLHSRSKALGLTMTAVGTAAFVAAAQDLFALGNEGGHLITFSRNCRRWLEGGRFLKISAPETPAFASMWMFVWVAALPTEEIRTNKKLAVAAYAERTKAGIEPHLTSPNALFSVDTMLKPFLGALSATDWNKPPPAPLAHSSHGDMLGVLPSRVESPSGHTGELVEYQCGGRVIDNTPALVTYTWNGMLHTSLTWDGKYYEREKYEMLNTKMNEYILAFIE